LSSKVKKQKGEQQKTSQEVKSNRPHTITQSRMRFLRWYTQAATIAAFYVWKQIPNGGKDLEFSPLVSDFEIPDFLAKDTPLRK
jgi:hypothetical protein